jgi:hypothetical protein
VCVKYYRSNTGKSVYERREKYEKEYYSLGNSFTDGDAGCAAGRTGREKGLDPG